MFFEFELLLDLFYPVPNLAVRRSFVPKLKGKGLVICSRGDGVSGLCVVCLLCDFGLFLEGCFISKGLS